MQSFNQRFAVRLGLVVCLFFVVACGGRPEEDDDGGGGGGATGITQSNGDDIARAVLAAAFTAGDVAGMTYNAIPPDSGAIQAADEIPGRDIPATTSRAAYGPTLVPCDVSGDVELSGDVADPLLYSQDDVVNGDYMLCDWGTGHEYDGVMDFTVAALTGDLLGSFSATLDMLYDTFLVDYGAGLTLNGTPMIDLDNTGAPVYVSSVYGGTLGMAEGGATATLTNFASDLLVDSGSNVFVFGADGTMTSSQFSGQVTFVTSIDFEGDLGGHPSVGRMKITGLSNTSVTIDVVDDTEVDLLIDLNGDGSPDALVTVPWVSGVGL